MTVIPFKRKMQRSGVSLRNMSTWLLVIVVLPWSLIFAVGYGVYKLFWG